jgi:hypothetical protein
MARKDLEGIFSGPSVQFENQHLRRFFFLLLQSIFHICGFSRIGVRFWVRFEKMTSSSRSWCVFQQSLEDVEITGELGKGQFGQVFRSKQDGTDYAVKQLLASEDDEGEKQGGLDRR